MILTYIREQGKILTYFIMDKHTSFFAKLNKTYHPRTKKRYLFRFHRNKRHQHLLHRDSSVLECIFIIGYVVVIIIRISEEILSVGENILTA